MLKINLITKSPMSYLYKVGINWKIQASTIISLYFFKTWDNWVI